jgi:hypothetical protein
MPVVNIGLRAFFVLKFGEVLIMVDEKKINGVDNGKVKFAGIIQKVEKLQNKNNEPFFITTLVVPAATPYDYPAKYPIYSQQSFGREGQEIELTCEVQSRFRNGFLNIGLRAVLN